MLAACRMAGHEAVAWVGHLEQLQLEPAQFAKAFYIIAQLPRDQQKPYVKVGGVRVCGSPWGHPA